MAIPGNYYRGRSLKKKPHIRTHAHPHTRTHASTHTHTHARTHTHTHTHPSFLRCHSIVEYDLTTGYTGGECCARVVLDGETVALSASTSYFTTATCTQRFDKVETVGGCRSCILHIDPSKNWGGFSGLQDEFRTPAGPAHRTCWASPAPRSTAA